MSQETNIDNVLVEKKLQFKFKFQRARRKALHRSMLLGRLAIFSQRVTVFTRARVRAAPMGREMDVRSRPVTSMLGGEGDRDQKFPRVGKWNLGFVRHVSCCVFVACGFNTRGCFLLGLPSSQLRSCCAFCLRLVRPGLFLVAVTTICQGASVNG